MHDRAHLSKGTIGYIGSISLARPAVICGANLSLPLRCEFRVRHQKRSDIFKGRGVTGRSLTLISIRKDGGRVLAAQDAHDQNVFGCDLIVD